MSDISNKTASFLAIIIFLLGMITGLLWAIVWDFNHTELIQSNEFGGAVPVKVYQIYDRDTGVYYAVTEKGGITVMYTMDGEIKLVDQGEGAIQHPNKGEQKNVN